MQHDKLLAWIENPDVSPSHRRLYLTMLGVCGQAVGTCPSWKGYDEVGRSPG